ncbi:MAG: BON domain-containing protein [Burkholderiaceae bacterium]
MQNHKMLSRSLAAAVLSLASLAAVSVQAADIGAGASSSADLSGAAGASGSAGTVGSSGATGSAGATDAATPTGSVSAYADDAMITTKVKAALIEDKQVKSLKIRVSTEEGVVKMSGVVPNADLGNRALQLAATVQGVKGVKNDLKLKGKG